MKTTTDEIALGIVKAWRTGAYYDQCQADAALQSAINDQLKLIYRRTRQMEEIGKLIREQDNRITDAPIFIVQQKNRIYGMDDGYTDAYDWCHTDGEGTADEVLAKRLDAKDRQGKSTGKWEKIGYQDTWEFVTACFTEQACLDYLKRNGHNLKETRIYADGSYRNEEYRAVREFLMGMPEPEICEWTECPEENPKATRTMWKGACGSADLFPRTGPTGTCRCGKPVKVTA